MNDLVDRVVEAKDHAVPGWTPERERLVRARVDVRVAIRRKWRRGFAVTVALAAMLGAVFFAWRHGTKHGADPTVAAHTVITTLLHLEDGSTVVAKTEDARVEPVEIGPSVASMRLLAGSARFSVTPNPNRAFRVLARDVTVTVLGTVFTVGLEPGGVRVAVERGRVHVAWPAGERVLAVGEEAFIPDAPVDEHAPTLEAPIQGSDVAAGAAEAPSGTHETGSAVEEGAAKEPHDTPSGASPGTAAHPLPATAGGSGNSNAAPVGASWRTLAQDGDYVGAYNRMQAEARSAVRDEPGDLLLAADVARLGGHPDRAIAPLQRVVEKHSRDSRAPLAAFTLGRTLLDQLGRPREAAAAFATARRLEPRGAMAQDALAREVESWSRAGEASLARERAEEYVSIYPKGRRLGAVRRLGGLE